jgi:SAM-dependent methyltransferase
MTASTGAIEADRMLKDKHRAMWALGDYPALAADIIPGLGQILVTACGVRAGDRVLDVATGSGNAAIPAARIGAHVVASDLTPELLSAGERQAAQQGIELEWRRADADELVRVCRPGGTIGLLNWTPEGFIGQMFAVMKPYAPPPPPGAQPPPLWGREDHVRALLGDRVRDVSVRRETVHVGLFARPEDFRDYFKARYGPTIAAYRNIAAEPDRTAALDQELADVARRHHHGTGTTVMDWEYLLLTARKQPE